MSKQSKPRSPRGKSRGTARRRPQPTGPAFNLTLDQKLDIAGIILGVVGILTLFSLFSFSQGELTDWYIKPLKETFGWGVFVVPIALIATGGWLLVRRFDAVP